MSLPFAPWHLWGGDIVVQMQASGAARADNLQIANVNYARPETWSFFLGATLQTPIAPAAQTDFRIYFDLITGVGRTAFDSKIFPFVAAQQPFCRMLFRVPAGSTADATQNKKWTTVTRTPLLEADDATSRLLIDHIVAQDIRAQATVFQDTVGATIAATLQLYAMFAPRSHIRPEWFTSPPKFNGLENAGR